MRNSDSSKYTFTFCESEVCNLEEQKSLFNNLTKSEIVEVAAVDSKVMSASLYKIGLWRQFYLLVIDQLTQNVEVLASLMTTYFELNTFANPILQTTTVLKSTVRLKLKLNEYILIKRFKSFKSIQKV